LQVIPSLLRCLLASVSVADQVFRIRR
jgi:hypothetical protein